MLKFRRRRKLDSKNGIQKQKITDEAKKLGNFCSLCFNFYEHVFYIENYNEGKAETCGFCRRVRKKSKPTASQIRKFLLGLKGNCTLKTTV